MVFNNVEIGFLEEFCKKYHVGIVINDGYVVKGINEKERETCQAK